MANNLQLVFNSLFFSGYYNPYDYQKNVKLENIKNINFLDGKNWQDSYTVNGIYGINPFRLFQENNSITLFPTSYQTLASQNTSTITTAQQEAACGLRIYNGASVLLNTTDIEILESSYCHKVIKSNGNITFKLFLVLHNKKRNSIKVSKIDILGNVCIQEDNYYGLRPFIIYSFPFTENFNMDPLCTYTFPINITMTISEAENSGLNIQNISVIGNNSLFSTLERETSYQPSNSTAWYEMQHYQNLSRLTNFNNKTLSTLTNGITLNTGKTLQEVLEYEDLFDLGSMGEEDDYFDKTKNFFNSENYVTSFFEILMQSEGYLYLYPTYSEDTESTLLLNINNDFIDKTDPAAGIAFFDELDQPISQHNIEIVWNEKIYQQNENNTAEIVLNFILKSKIDNLTIKYIKLIGDFGITPQNYTSTQYVPIIIDSQTISTTIDSQTVNTITLNTNDIKVFQYRVGTYSFTIN